MAQPRNTTDYAHATIREFADGLSRDFGVFAEINKGTATRLVWFVAISGFALLNVRDLAEAVARRRFDGILLFLLVLPWVIAAVLGLVAHWLLGDVTAKDTVYYIMKQHAIRAFLATASSHPTIAETLSILDVDDTDKEVASRKKAVEQVSPWADAAEKATFAAIIFSLVWSVVYPLIIRAACAR